MFIILFFFSALWVDPHSFYFIINLQFINNLHLFKKNRRVSASLLVNSRLCIAELNIKHWLLSYFIRIACSANNNNINHFLVCGLTLTWLLAAIMTVRSLKLRGATMKGESIIIIIIYCAVLIAKVKFYFTLQTFLNFSPYLSVCN